MPGIFVSYRRGDAAGSAGRLASDLVERFGDQIIQDIDSFKPGVNFVKEIEKAVKSCDVLLAIIGPGWVTAVDGKGRRRLDKPQDFVRLEIGIALKREDVRVIPVLVHDAEMPDEDALPDDLKTLSCLNAIEITDTRWQYDVGRLVDSLATSIQPKPPPQPQPQPPQPQPQPPSRPKSYVAGLLLQVLGFGMHYAAPHARRRWLYPLAMAGIGLVVFLSGAPRGPFHQCYGNAGQMSCYVDWGTVYAALAAPGAVAVLGFVDVLWACRRSRRRR